MATEPSTSQDVTDLSVTCTILEKLKSKISSDILKQFNTNVDLDKRLDIMETLLLEHNLLPEFPMVFAKDNDESVKSRNEGDEYLEKNSLDGIKFYNRCIAYADPETEFLSIGYAHRAKALFKWKFYGDSLRNLRLALRTKHCSADLRDELEKLKELCENELKISPPRIHLDTHRSDIDQLTKLGYPKHSKVPCIVNCLELVDLPKFGRGIITNNDLKTGDVIAIEKPFSSCLFKPFQYRFCTYCAKLSWSLIPCLFCPMVMYCNRKCLEIAYEKFHKYECKVLNYIFEIFPSNRLMDVRNPLRVILLFKGNIDRLIEFYESNPNNTDIFNIDSDTFDYDYDEDDDEDDDEVDPDGGLDIKKKLTETNYYPMYGLIKNVTEPKNRSQYLCTIYAIQSIIIKNLFDNILYDYIKTDKHKHFIRKFIYNQFEIARSYYHSLQFVNERPSSTPLLRYFSVSYGSGVYPFSALINHSCAPNIMRMYDGTTVTIVVLRPIQKGEQLFDNYSCTYWMKNKSVRQNHLSVQYQFICDCVACLNDFQLMKALPRKSLPNLFTLTNTLVGNYPLADLIQIIKNLYSFLNEHSSSNFPCFEVLQMEFILKGMFSNFIRRRVLHVPKKY